MASRKAVNMAGSALGAGEVRPEPESSILAKIIRALGCEHDLRLFRNNVGVARYGGSDARGDGQRVRYGLLPGSSDLIGILAPTGRLISLEVKSATGRVTTEQDAWLRMVRRMGGFAAVVRSVEDARAALDRARRGESE